jgi:hypothetical protein
MWRRVGRNCRGNYSPACVNVLPVLGLGWYLISPRECTVGWRRRKEVGAPWYLNSWLTVEAMRHFVQRRFFGESLGTRRLAGAPHLWRWGSKKGLWSFFFVEGILWWVWGYSRSTICSLILNLVYTGSFHYSNPISCRMNGRGELGWNEESARDGTGQADEKLVLSLFFD